MFHVDVVLDKSNIHGIGVFARENIKKGQLVYTDNPMVNLLLSPDKFNTLEVKEQEYIQHYGHFDREKKKWYLAFDNISFLNHALSSNVTLTNKGLVALKDISCGQELLQNYQELNSAEGRNLVN